ncbi:hypothetical protein GUITHDRAFT_156082 [Guillardia theta CCMP2712]|uniref:Uncharacterized protein n=1 Tax=Guillardia theta (strain CCMP2712) TaxID=905079 RepID=L1IBP2_GUITC|nr:hypothetical protein GUITHDRAFT_156082 [Guillardia theta CCMP2712]EKX33319.1 hypothetical protein GUITHDRAFT_156082 [Guillardia theta CCMP2712]|eukprot:XP_005820299.1 hypothetical protein GUITHDRAFT_156082 [Guillardia theta CCMP2712]
MPRTDEFEQQVSHICVGPCRAAITRQLPKERVNLGPVIVQEPLESLRPFYFTASPSILQPLSDNGLIVDGRASITHAPLFQRPGPSLVPQWVGRR